MILKTKLILISILITAVSGFTGGLWFYKLYTQPINIRHATSWVHPLRLIQDYKRCSNLNRKGLNKARFSGSGSLPLNHLNKLRSLLSPKLFVINGLPGDIWHINGRYIRQLCYEYDGSTLSTSKKRHGFQCKLRQFIAGIPFLADQVPPQLIQSQSQRMFEESIPYSAPLPENWTSQWSYVDELLQVFDNIDPTQTHLHFHCEYGKGRTTTLMALYDIFLNSKSVSVEDIIDRQYCLGGEDLGNIIAYKKGTWTQAALVDRKKLVYAFYDYMNDPHGHGHFSWGQWLMQKELQGYQHLPTEARDSLPHRTNDRV